MEPVAFGHIHLTSSFEGPGSNTADPVDKMSGLLQHQVNMTPAGVNQTVIQLVGKKFNMSLWKKIGTQHLICGFLISSHHNEK